jgi:PKD repeat protein
MIPRSSRHALPAILLVLFVCMILIPCASAAVKTTVKTTATVPPVLMACSHATSPQANITCRFPGNPLEKIPDGPPYTVQCSDTSSSASNQSIDSWKWEFGDGGTSTVQHPEHTYSRAGQYNIRLTVTTLCGSQYSNTTVRSMDIYCSLPEPAFTTNVTEGSAPLAVQVTDGSQSTPEDITTWTYWSDNTPFSNDRNPVFFFTTPGTHTIRQTVWKDCVQAGSTSYPSYIREINVNPPSSLSSEGNGTGTPLTTSPTLSPVTSAVPAATTSPAETVQGVPEVPGNGTLSVITEPAGVKIFLDNVLRGTSPATVPDLPAGSHTLRLEKEGYRNMTIPVQINDGKVTGSSTNLTPVSGESEILPVIALAIIIFGVAGAWVHLLMVWKRKKE